MPYQKSEKSRFGESSGGNKYYRSGSEGYEKNSRGGCWLGFMLAFAVIFAIGYYYTKDSEGVDKLIYKLKSKSRSLLPESECYQYELEITSDDYFLRDSTVNYAEASSYFRRLVEDSVQGSVILAQQLRTYVMERNLSQIVLLLRQCDRDCWQMCEEYRRTNQTDVVVDLMQMKFPLKGTQRTATPYEVTYIIHLLWEHYTGEESLIIVYDIMNALNSQNSKRISIIGDEMRQGCACSIWMNYRYLTEQMGQPENLLQSLERTRIIPDKKRRMKYEMGILKCITNDAIYNNIPERNVKAFHSFAMKNIGKGSRSAKKIDEAFDRYIRPFYNQ